MGTEPGSSGASAVVSQPRWKFTQWFKKMAQPNQAGNVPADADHLTAAAFNPPGAQASGGEFLATGDKAGRVVVLESDGDESTVHYRFFCEFQSHEPEFDYVRSLNVEERINRIQFLDRTNDAVHMLTTNDKAIKLYKIFERQVEAVTKFNVDRDPATGVPSSVLPSSVSSVESLQLPRLDVVESVVAARLRRGYALDVHQFHINSLSRNVDGETFLSADNLRINLWNIHHSDRAMNVVDTKPVNMQDLTEVITNAEFHPTDCHTFLYSTSKGGTRIGDFRDRALFAGDNSTKLYAIPEDAPGVDKSFFADVTQSISDAKFLADGRTFATRDFLTVKLWDVKMEREPIESIHVHDFVQSKLWDLYESEAVYDAFEIAASSDGKLCTGSYGNYFHVYDVEAKTDTLIEAVKPPVGVFPMQTDVTVAAERAEAGASNGGASARTSAPSSGKKKRGSRTGRGMFGRKKASKKNQQEAAAQAAPPADGRIKSVDFDASQVDYEQKILQTAWHPARDALVVAGSNNLFLYALTQPPPPSTGAANG